MTNQQPHIDMTPRISIVAILALWFFLFLAPAGLMFGVLNALIDQDEQLRRALLEQTLSEEMKRYLDDLTPERFFQHHVEQAARPFADAALSENPQRRLNAWRHRFSRSLGAPFHLLAMGSTTGGPFTLTLPEQLPSTWTPARARMALAQLFTQQRRKVFRLAPEPPPSAYPDAAALFTDILGPNGPMIIVSAFHGETETLYSPLTPETILWYTWFLAPFTDRPGTYNALVAVREDRLALEKRFAFARSQVTRPDLRRTLAVVGGSNKPRFLTKAGYLWFVDLLPQHISSLIPPGSRHIRAGRLPMAAVGAPLTAFAHPLRTILPLLRTALFLMIFVSAILIVGFASGNRIIPLSIRGKIMMAIAAGIWIPLVGTILCLASYQRLQGWAHANRSLDDLEESLEQSELSLFSLDRFLELDMLDARGRLEGERGSFSPERLQRLIDFNAGIPYKTYPIALGADGRDFISEQNREDTNVSRAESQEVFLKLCRGFAIDLLSKLGSLQVYEPDEKRRNKLLQIVEVTQGLGDALIDPRIINRLLTNAGALLPLPFSQVFERASAVFITPNGDPKRPPYAFFLLTTLHASRYREFLQRSVPQQLFNVQRIRGYTTKKAIYRFTSKNNFPTDDQDYPTNICRNPRLRDLALRSRRDRTDLRIDRSGDRQPYLMAARYFRDKPFIGAALAEPVNSPVAGHLTIVVAGIALLLFLGASLGTTALLWWPLKACLQAIRRTSAGRYDWTLDVKSGDELEFFAESLNGMIGGIRERERMSRFVSDDALALAASDDDAMLEPGGEYVEATIMTSDIRNFTTLSERYPPEQIVALLNAYFTRMEGCIRAHGGRIDKFIGDALTAVFREEDGSGDHAVRACMAALEMRTELAALNREREVAGQFVIQTGIGLASGRVIAGRVGSSTGRLDAAYIGDAVLLSAHTESRSKGARVTGILLAPSTVRLLRGRGRIEFLERVTPDGKSRAFSLYELVELRDPAED
ncbi:MAG TPA: adenylate/guanylate cyclase domain-containing protein [Candidatus Ozemobacteraceae bacterium]|nr:adenylate/guanylate cyclase domain-containing protein [Candidatus Ozemobacteraceae bacterium]